MIKKSQVSEISTRIENEILVEIENNLTIWINDYGSVSVDRVDSNSHQASCSWGRFPTYQDAYREMNSSEFVLWYEENYR